MKFMSHKQFFANVPGDLLVKHNVNDIWIMFCNIRKYETKIYYHVASFYFHLQNSTYKAITTTDSVDGTIHGV